MALRRPLPRRGAIGLRQGLVDAAGRGPPFGRANGSDAKLHGQGPRAEARAARHAPACEARDARGVPP